MNIFSLCGIALISFAAIEIIGKEEQKIGMIIGIVGALCLFAPALLTLAGVYKDLASKIEEYRFIGGEILFRSFGIGLCCETTGSVLKDAGRESLSKALEFAGKTAIFALCLPLFKEVFTLIEELLT